MNPIVLIEISSPSTQAVDRNQKLNEYTQIPDLEEYVLVSHDEYKVESFLRQDDRNWRYTYVTSKDAVIELPSIQCKLELYDVYINIDIEDIDEDEGDQ